MTARWTWAAERHHDASRPAPDRYCGRDVRVPAAGRARRSVVNRVFALGGAGAVVAAVLWWRKHPSACPYGQRFWVEAPHPLITRARLREVLAPQPSERVLEVGPGTGYYTLDVAEWVAPGGTVEILDLQEEMLDHTLRRARERG